MLSRFSPLLMSIWLLGCAETAVDDPHMLSVAAVVDAPTVRFDFRLRNTATGPTKLSALGDGTLRVVAFTRDGAPVGALQSVARATQHLAYDLPESLELLAPAEIREFCLETESDPFFGGDSLQIFSLDADADLQSDRFDVSQTGSYSATFRYEYPAVANSDADTFSGESNEATVTFEMGGG